MSAKEHAIDCPNCGARVVRGAARRAPFFPFCSERCKLLDLGKWFDEEHRIEQPLGPDDGPDADAGQGA